MSRMSFFFCGLALSVSLFALLASPARAESAGDPCQVPTVGRVYSVEGPDGPSLVCNGTTLDVYESVTGNPTRKGIATASPKTTLDVNGEIRVNTTGINCNADREGALRYDSAGGAPWEYCNGSAWVPFEQAGAAGCAAPAICPNVGDECSDGTVLAGFHIYSNDGRCEPVFVPPCDLGMSWDGSSCTGTRTGLSWNNENSTGHVDTTLVNNDVFDGSAQTFILIATDSDSVAGGTQPHQAAQSCADLSYGGHTDWFLPALHELAVLYKNRTVIGNFDTTGTKNYWSSSEYDNISAWRVVFTNNGAHSYTDKRWSGGNYLVRCMRRECDDIGEVCNDGTIYAGLSPDGNVKMYTTPADAGTFTWNNGTSNWIDTAMSNASYTTGEANTTLLVGLSDAASPYAAAVHCDGLTAHGHSDWYLPARDELDVLYDNLVDQNGDNTPGGPLGSTFGFNISGSFPAGFYWSSSEDATYDARYQRFSDGIQLSDPKFYDVSVRCVRR